MPTAGWRAFYLGLGVLFAADAMLLAAVIWTAYRLGGSAIWISLGAVTYTLPVIVAGVGGTGAAGRMVRRLSHFAWAGAISALAIALVVGFGRSAIWGLLALALVAGLMQSLRLPLGQAQLMEQAEGDEIAHRAALYEVASRAGVVVGPAVAGGLLALWGPQVAFVAVALSYTVGAALWRSFAGDLIASPDRDQPYALSRGVALVRQDSWLLPALSLRAGGNLLWPAFTLALPLLAATVWHGGALGYGISRSVWGVGTVVATSLFVWLRLGPTQRQRGYVWCWIGTGIGFVLIGSAPSLIWGLLAVGLTAAGSPLLHIAVNSHIAERVPRHWRSDLYGMQRLVVNGVQTIGLLALAPVADLLNPARLMDTVGILMVALAVASWWWMARRQGRAEPGGGAPAVPKL